MDFAPPRGTQDWLPPESERLRGVYEAAHRVAALFGYRFLEVPTFESTELFARTSGETSDVVNKEMYTFEDRGGRSLSLRPEGTAPVIRAYLKDWSNLPSPFKGYYVETLFRYGRPQRGRLREYRSFGIEVVAYREPEADVEVIAVGARLLRELGVTEYELQLNSLGDHICRPKYRAALLEFIDRHAKDLQDEHRSRYRENPMRVLDCKDPACKAVAANAPKMVEGDFLFDACKTHFEAVKRGLEEEDIAFVINPTLVRGLDYYTRTAFEFVSPRLSPSQSTIIGGGRYDGLAEVLEGRSTPAVGFGSGIERLMLAASLEGAELDGPHRLSCYVVVLKRTAWEYGRNLLRTLRRQGVSADMSFDFRPFQTQFDMAHAARAQFAVIAGEREEAAGTVSWRRLSDATQSVGTIDEAINAIRLEQSRELA